MILDGDTVADRWSFSLERHRKDHDHEQTGCLRRFSAATSKSAQKPSSPLYPDILDFVYALKSAHCHFVSAICLPEPVQALVCDSADRFSTRNESLKSARTFRSLGQKHTVIVRRFVTGFWSRRKRRRSQRHQFLTVPCSASIIIRVLCCISFYH